MNDPMLDRLSPARHADNLSVPLLLIHGTIDTVVPFNESKAMLNAARRAGKSVQLVTLTGEVDSQSKRSQAARVAASVPSVQQVVNELQIKNQKATSSM